MAYELHNFEAGQVLTAEALNKMENQIKSNEDSLANKQDSGDYVTSEALTEALSSKQDAGAYITQELLTEQLSAKQDSGDYVTKEEYNALVARVEALEGIPSE